MSKQRRILMVSPEISPFISLGGLGEVLDSLPKALSAKGLDVRLFIPLTGGLEGKQGLKDPFSLNFSMGNQEHAARVWTYVDKGVIVYFLEHEAYFGRKELYAGPWGDHWDNGGRFAFFDKASLEFCLKLDWIPNLIHCHDWTTGLIPVYLNTVYKESALKKTATLLTIHNLQHQGLFDPSVLSFAGLPSSEFQKNSLECLGRINFLKGGLYHATRINTVSPSYAEEVKTPTLGCGLDSLLRFRAADFFGILNGIDELAWNPAKDPFLPAKYSARSKRGKKTCKRFLQKMLSLQEDVTIPIFSVVGRWVHQKGLDLLADCLPRVLDTMRVQFILMGSGEPALEAVFDRFAATYPGRLAVRKDYQVGLAHQIQAGADCLVMPSRFEPCGLSQLYALRYGTLPIVSNTGGLRDTVVTDDFSGRNKRTGFRIKSLDPKGIYGAIGGACALYYARPELFDQMFTSAMQEDFSWKKSAEQYIQAYEWAIEARRSGFDV